MYWQFAVPKFMLGMIVMSRHSDWKDFGKTFMFLTTRHVCVTNIIFKFCDVTQFYAYFEQKHEQNNIVHYLPYF